MLLNLAANKSKNVVEPAKMHDAVPVLADSPFLSTGVNVGIYSSYPHFDAILNLPDNCDIAVWS